jgi:gluconokinase
VVVILMGVTGAGKTTVGKLLAQKFGWDFADADEFHSAANIEKMSHGIPLDDSDRVPWLQAMHDAIVGWNRSGKNIVLACSALKIAYRTELSAGAVQFVHLKGSRELILSRLQARRGHFAAATILDGQFRDLDEPTNAITVEIDKSPGEIVSEIAGKLALAGNGERAPSSSRFNPLQ